MEYFTKAIFTLIFATVTLATAAQKSSAELLEKGLGFRESGNCRAAIELFNEAIEAGGNSDSLQHELARSYFESGDYDKAIAHAEQVLKMDSHLAIQAWLIKGSSLDASGRIDEAIDVFKKAIEETGGHFLLHYNASLSYFQKGDLNNATSQILKAIELNPAHASNHLMLAHIQYEMGNRVKSILAMHYFLFLEPHSERSLGAYEHMRDSFDGTNGETDTRLEDLRHMSNTNLDSAFESAELMLNNLQNNRGTFNKSVGSDLDFFTEKNKLFFARLNELKPDEHNSIWWDFYVPFFYRISSSEHNQTYCMYISQTASESAKLWLQNNSDKLNAFDTWLVND